MHEDQPFYTAVWYALFILIMIINNHNDSNKNNNNLLWNLWNEAKVKEKA